MNYRNTEKLILASGSPRRRDLLTQACLNFDIHVSAVDESTVPVQPPDRLVCELARLKATDVARSHPDTWTLGADTIVVIDDTILGKPDSIDSAVSMLNRLNNRIHRVFTGFCITHPGTDQTVTRHVSTDVAFKHLSKDEIDWYVSTKEPFDKAGGYGIQDMGAFMVKSVNGSYTNVVGLPVCEVIDELNRLNIINL